MEAVYISACGEPSPSPGHPVGYHGATSCGRAHRAIFFVKFYEFLYDFMNISGHFMNFIIFTHSNRINSKANRFCLFSWCRAVIRLNRWRQFVSRYSVPPVGPAGPSELLTACIRSQPFCPSLPVRRFPLGPLAARWGPLAPLSLPVRRFPFGASCRLLGAFGAVSFDLVVYVISICFFKFSRSFIFGSTCLTCLVDINFLWCFLPLCAERSGTRLLPRECVFAALFKLFNSTCF